MGQHKQQRTDERDDFSDQVQRTTFVNWGATYQWLNIYAREMCVTRDGVEERFTCLASVPVSKSASSMREIYASKQHYSTFDAIHILVIALGQFTEVLKDTGNRHNVEIISKLEASPGESYGAVME